MESCGVNNGLRRNLSNSFDLPKRGISQIRNLSKVDTIAQRWVQICVRKYSKELIQMLFLLLKIYPVHPSTILLPLQPIQIALLYGYRRGI